MTVNLFERLGWTVVCSKCKRPIPPGTPPAFCHACYYGYTPTEKTP